LRPPPTEIAEFEMKNRCKSAEEVKAEHFARLLLLYFQRQKRGANQAILVGGSNKTGVWRQSSRRCGDFTAFYTKIRIFSHILIYIST